MVILAIIVDIRVVILLVVVGSCNTSSRKSIYSSSVCIVVVGVVNIVSVFVLVQAV